MAAERSIAPTGPFDLATALAYLRAWTAATFETVEQHDDLARPGSYRRALRLAGQDVLLTVVAEDATLRLTVRPADGDALRSGAVDAAEQVVRRVFTLDTDPRAFRAHVARSGDPVLGALVVRLPLMRPVTIADPFEALLWAVLGQQINVGFARTLKLRLVELAGRDLTVDGRRYRMMPLPEAVAALDPDSLRALQFSRQKTAYVLDLSAAVARGEIDLPALRGIPADEAIAELTRHRGIGRWTAEYLLMRALGHPDSIPAGDVSLRKLVGVAHLGRPASEAELRAIAAPWSPWRGWAAFHWWLEGRVAPALGFGL